MAGPVDQIGAAIPVRALLAGSGWNGLPSRNRNFQPPSVRRILNGNGTSWRAPMRLHRRQRFQIGEQVAHVVELHALIGRIGKRREEMLAVRRGALHHGGDEIRLAPLPDAVVRRRARCSARRTCRTAISGRARRRGASCRPGPAWHGRRRSRRQRTWSCRCRDWASAARARSPARWRAWSPPRKPRTPSTAAITAETASFRNTETSLGRAWAMSAIAGGDVLFPRTEPAGPITPGLRLRTTAARRGPIGDRAGWQARSGPPRCARSSAHRARESRPPCG